MRDERILLLYLATRWVMKWAMLLAAVLLPFMILGAAFFHEGAR